MDNIFDLNDVIEESPPRTRRERLDHHHLKYAETTSNKRRVAREQIPLPFIISDLVKLIGTYLSYPEICRWRRTCRHFSYLLDLETLMYPLKTQYLRDQHIDPMYVGAIYQNHKYLRFLRINSMPRRYLTHLINSCLDGRECYLARNIIRRELTAHATRKRWRHKLSSQIVSNLQITKATVIGPGGLAFLRDISKLRGEDLLLSISLIECVIEEGNLEILEHLLTSGVERLALERIAIIHNRTNVLTYLSKTHGQYHPLSNEADILMRIALQVDLLAPLKHLIESGQIVPPHHINLYSHRSMHLDYLESLGYVSYYEYGMLKLDRREVLPVSYKIS